MENPQHGKLPAAPPSSEHAGAQLHLPAPIDAGAWAACEEAAASPLSRPSSMSGTGAFDCATDELLQREEQPQALTPKQKPKEGEPAAMALAEASLLEASDATEAASLVHGADSTPAAASASPPDHAPSIMGGAPVSATTRSSPEEHNARMQPFLQALASSEQAAAEAAEKAAALLRQDPLQVGEAPIVEACKIVRALCLAGRVTAAGASARALVTHLLDPCCCSPLLHAAIGDALVSVTVRDRIVALAFEAGVSYPGRDAAGRSGTASPSDAAPPACPAPQPCGPALLRLLRTYASGRPPSSSGGSSDTSSSRSSSSSSSSPAGTQQQQPLQPASGVAAAAVVGSPPTAQVAGLSSSPTYSAMGSPPPVAGLGVAGGPAACRQALVSLFRLTGALTQHKQSLVALLKGGLCATLAAMVCPGAAVPAADAAGALAAGAARPPTPPIPPTPAAVLAQQSSLQLLLALSQRPPLLPVLLGGGVPDALCRLLHQGRPLGAAGAAGAARVAAAAAAGPQPSAETLQAAVGVVNNLAGGGPPCQDALVRAGLPTALVPLLGSRSAPVLFNTLDALSNLTISCPAAQDAVETAGQGVWPPGVAARAAAAAAAAGDGAGAEATSAAGSAGGERTALSGGAGQMAAVNVAAAEPTGELGSTAAAEGGAVAAEGGSGIVALLVSMLQSKHVVLVTKACRCLSNLVLDHPSTHAALLACKGGLPTLVKLAACGVPSVVRLALNALANVVGRSEAAQAAAFEAGALPVVVALLHDAAGKIGAAKAAQQAAQAQQKGQQKGQQAQDSQGAGAEAGAKAEQGARNVQQQDKEQVQQQQQQPQQQQVQQQQQQQQDVKAAVAAAERVCMLLANLVYHSRDAKLRVVESGAVPPLVQLLSSSYPSVAAGAAAALSNLPVRDPELQNRLAADGALSKLLALLPGAPGVPPITSLAPGTAAADVAGKACHAIGSLVFNNPATQAVVLESGAAERLMAVLRRPQACPSVTAEAVRVVGNLSLHNAAAKAQLRDMGAIELLTALLKLPQVATVKAALVALVNITDGCPDNQAAALDAGVAACLVQLLRVRGEEVVARAAFCMHTIASPGTMEGPAQPGGVLGATAALPAAGQVSPVCARAQAAMAEAGALPQLVRLLTHPRADLVDKALLALSSLVHGNKSNQVRTAAAGGIAPLAALIESPNPQLSRHVVDTMIELGGAHALVKLLGHKHPAVVEQAARRIAARVAAGASMDLEQALGPVGPVAHKLAPANKPAGGGGGGGLVPAATSASGELLRAGAAGALVRAAQGGGGKAGGGGGAPPPRVLEALLSAMAALLAACGSPAAAARVALVDAGALGCLQQLMGHRAAAVSRLASAVSAQMFVK